ncbi:MAG: LPS assembly lipoprotein LptE [Ancalomicrobiaceae bacterium]|nr:LPS assembly lipoprotein LptE [Ancalomicrobiaceae bacterium]
MRRPALLLAVGLAAGLLSGLGPTGCTTVQPLYGSLATPGHNQVVEQLRHVDVNAGGRVGQHIRNELVFGFYGGDGVPDKVAYRLNVQVADNSIPVDTARYSDLPAAYLQQLSVSFTLVDTKTQKTLLTGTSFANAAYDISTQRFANIRAARDAEDRAAVVIANDIHVKLAAFFSKSH